MASTIAAVMTGRSLIGVSNSVRSDVHTYSCPLGWGEGGRTVCRAVRISTAVFPSTLIVVPGTCSSAR
jgi:hypothetical protein